MSEIKRGANVAGTVPATGPAAIRTTALLPGNRTSNMTVGSGPGSGTNRTGVGIGGNNLSRIANSHLSGDSSPSVSAENVHMDESKSPDGDTVPSSSTPSNQILKSIASSIKSISGAVPIRMTNNVSHANHLSQPSDLNEITSNTGVLSSAVHESQIEDIVNNEDESPNKKRLRLDVNAANAVRDNLQLNSKEVRRHRISGESLLDRRKRIHEHRKSRLQRLHKSYSQNATEHYFIQNHVPPGSFVDLQAFRKKPNLPFLNYLKANKAPSDFLQEVALAVLGHNNSLESIGEDSTGSGSNAGKTYKNHSPNSIKNETNIQTLTVKLPSSKPSFQQGVSNQNDENSPFYPLHFCGRVTSAAMAQAIHLARKNRNLQSPQVHPFSNQDYGSSSHLSKANNSLLSQDSLPASQPSKFPPYLPKILSASEMGGVMYGPKLESFPPSTGSTLNLPTVPIATSYNDLQSRISGNGIASQPQSITSSAPAQLTTLFKSTLPRYPREQFYEKCRQEPFVVRTIAHLSREGLWSQKRLPKVCERPRPRTHWDSILSEMQWLAVDYHQERKWKKAAAKILAYSAKEYVEQWEERKRLKTEQREKNSRAIAKFVSGEILKFWQSMRSLHYDQHRNFISSKSYNQIDSDCVPINSIEQKDLNTSDTSSTRMLLSNVDELHSRKMLKRRRNNSNGSNCTSIVYNELTLDQDLDKEDDVELFELAESDMNASDDELTIEEQENFENENTIIDRRLEWDTLLADNQKAVDDLLKTNYSAYWAALNDNSLDDLNTYEDSSGVEDGGSDSDDESIGDAVEDNENEFDIKSSEIFSHQDFDLEAVEKVIHVPLSSKQRFLYDDYMAGPDVHKALEGDGQTLSIVLNNLRKICNHPGLVFDNDIYSVTNEPTFSLVFPRVIDHQYWHPKFLHAIEYDPWKQIDLSSLNMVYFDHEFTLTAITSDRIRKCCASRKLIEELSSNKNSVPADNVAHNTNIKKTSAFGPPVPSNRLKLEIHPTTNPQHSHISSIAGNMQSSSSSVLFNQSSRLSSNPQNQQRDQQLVQTINGQHMFYTSTIIKKEPDTINDEIKASSDDENNTEMKENIVGKKIQHHAFHKDSLHVIARFNERRCNGMPLFGRDLVEALTVVDSVRPIKSSKGSTQNHMKRSGQGYVNCLNAGMNDLTCIARPRKRSKAVKEDPEYRYQTNALKKLITSVTSSYQIHSEWCNSMIRIPAPVLLTCVNWNSPLHRQYTRRVLPSLQKLSKEMKFPQEINLSLPTLLPTMKNLSVCSRIFRVNSAKLQQLDIVLRDIRNKQERALVFCQMPQMIGLLETYFKLHHIKYLYIENSASIHEKSRKLELFSSLKNILVLLTSTSTPPPPPSAACLWPNNLKNVVFFDSNWNNTINTETIPNCGKQIRDCGTSIAPCLAWCRQLNQRLAFLPLLESPIQSKAFFSFPNQPSNLKVCRLVCEETIEDSISKKTLQQKLLGDLKLKINNTTADIKETKIDRVEHNNLKTANVASLLKIKRQTLEDLLFNNQHHSALPTGGDNGIFSATSESAQRNHKVTNDKDSLMLEEMLNDVEAISQLDWLWSNKLKENRTSTSSLNNVVEMAQVELNNVDGCDNTFEEDYLLQNKLMESQSKPLNIKPIERYALSFFARTENEDELDILDDKFQDLSPSLKFHSPALNSAGTRESIYDEEYKLQWELQYQSQLAELEAEQEHLDSLPFIVYSTEDGGRTSSKNWFGRDGQPMPLWSPPMPSAMHPSYLMQLQDPSGSELTSNYFSYLYDTIRLMDENELPPVYVKKELAPMHNKLEPMLGTNLHGLSSSGDIPGLNQIDYKKGIRNENYGSIGGLIPGPTYAPRSLFDRPVNPQKVRPKVPRPHPQSGVGRDGLPKQVPSLPFHPLPRPQVEAESAPDWLVAEDWALLTAVRDLLELPLNLQATSPAHTPNWDMIADMVNSVSHVYRGPRQCRNRYETIVVPREEGRILFDLSSIAPPDLSQMGTPTSKKKKKQDKKSLPQPTPKPNRPIKTATLFKQDDNRAWTQMFGNRFGSIKAVAMKRAPTTKPLVVNPVPKNSKHAQVLSESGISYDAPLNPISVAANRAERIQKEKQRTQQDQQQQRITAAQQVASAVQRQAATQGTAAVAVQQHPPGTVVTPGGPRVAVASLPLQQQQQTTVVQASATLGQQPSGQAPQAVVVGISQPITSVTNNQHVVQQTSPHPSVLQTGRNLQPIGVQERILVSQQTQQQSQSPNQPQQSTVVVSGQHQQPSTVGTVINLPPSAAQKIVGQSSVVTSRAAAGGLVSFAGRQLTPQQFNALKQQALLKKSQQQEAQNAAAIAKARLQSLQPAQLPQVTAVTLSSASGSQVQAATAPTIMGQATTSTGQKVSVAVAPGGGVSLANVANAVSASGNIVVTSTMTGAVTVVTQAMTSGQPKAHLIRQVNSLGKGTVRTFSDSEMKLLVQKQQQLNQQQQQSGQTAKAQIQLPTHVTSSTGQTAITAQFLAQHGIQVQQTPGGPSVATLVKTTTAGTSSSGNLPTQSVTIPVAAGAMNLPQIRAALSRSGVTNPQQVQMLQKQLLQRKQLQQGGIAIGQGAKGLPAQLIVSSGGNPVSGVTAQKTGLPQSVTVQQIQQIVKSGQVVSAAPPSSANATVVSQGQILPHSAILTAKAGSSPATVQARVIPVSSGALNATPNTVQPGNNIGRTQQIQVVAASPNQAVNAALSAVRQVGVAPGAAPNVTVDASGRPTSGTGSANTTTTQFANAYAAAAAAGGSPTIRIQGGNGQQQQQIISQVSAALAASSSGGHPVSVAVRGPTASVLAAAQQAAQQGSGSVPTVATSTAKSQTGSSSTVTNASSVSASPSTQAEGKS